MRKILWVIIFTLLLVLTFTITCRVFESSFAEATIDYFAFFAGIFLIIEGTYKLVSSKSASLSDQVLRTLRIIIGTCVFTIHLLQFMRY